MPTPSLFTVLPTLFREIVEGSPDPAGQTYLLNQGDEGLLASLERLSAERASAREHAGASIAAHADHLRYGFAVLNQWVSGTPLSSIDADWTASWKRTAVTEEEWRSLLRELRREAAAWLRALETPRELSEIDAGWLGGSVAHVAYHLGAIRQIDRATRGPTAEDEARAKAASRER